MCCCPSHVTKSALGQLCLGVEQGATVTPALPVPLRQILSASGLAGIPWEKMPQHSRSLFPYEEEQVETAILKLTLRVPSNAVDTPGNHQAQDGISLETHGKPQTFK